MQENGEQHNRESTGKVTTNERNVNDRKSLPHPTAFADLLLAFEGFLLQLGSETSLIEGFGGHLRLVKPRAEGPEWEANGVTGRRPLEIAYLWRERRRRDDDPAQAGSCHAGTSDPAKLRNPRAGDPRSALRAERDPPPMDRWKALSRFAMLSQIPTESVGILKMTET